MTVPNPCWCCGRECMFCLPEDIECCYTPDGKPIHWCSECKFAGCNYCCGCKECEILQRAGWSPRGTANEDRVPHPSRQDVP